MTTIAFRGGVMAADTLSLTQENGVTLRSQGVKLHRVNGKLLGLAGSSSAGALFLDWLRAGEGPVSSANTCHFRAMEWDGRELAIWGTIDGWERFGLWRRWRRVGYLRNPRTDAFMAIGSGGDAALAAMHMGASAEEAVRVAMKVDASTGGDVVSLTL